MKASIVIAFIAGIILSPRLWINSERFFPVLKPIEIIPALTFPFDFILISLFVLSCIAWIFFENRIIGLIVIVCLTVILLQDQMRWQPWAYLYFLMLLPFLIQSNSVANRKLILICLQWIIAGVYIWSGIQKWNLNFLEGTFAHILNTSGVGGELESWKKAGYIIPLIEISTGLALIMPRFRKTGVLIAAITHVGILIYLSAFAPEHNWIVYPWNIAMIVFVCLLFWNNSDSLFVTFREIHTNLLLAVPVILIWLFPLLNFLGYWDHYLSFSLYSGKPSKFYIAIEKGEIHKIDKRFKNYFADIQGLQGGHLIDMDKWTFAYLNVPFYPESRLFKKISGEFCDLGIDHDKLVFLELFYSDGILYNKFTCEDMRPQ
jgi:uncharacterized membrane protein YphA (DoxX/SURF4 family)